MFFKKKEKKEEVSSAKTLTAAIDGVLIPIEEVKDPVFSEKMMGDGFAITSNGDTICACCDGKVTMVFPSNHAVGLTCSDGMEVLIHIGIDTVNENGTGFTLLTAMNKEVKAGEPLVRMDRAYLEGKGYDLSVIMIFTKPDAYNDFAIAYGKEVKAGDMAGTYTLK